MRAGYSVTLSVSRGLRAPGAGVKPWADFLFPFVKLWFERKRASGCFVDAEIMLFHFEHLMLLFTGKLELMTIRSRDDERRLKEICKLTKRISIQTTRDYWVLRLTK